MAGVNVDANAGPLNQAQARRNAKGCVVVAAAQPQALRAGQGASTGKAAYDPLPLLILRSGNTAGLERRIRIRPGGG